MFFSKAGVVEWQTHSFQKRAPQQRKSSNLFFGTKGGKGNTVVKQSSCRVNTMQSMLVATVGFESQASTNPKRSYLNLSCTRRTIWFLVFTAQGFEKGRITGSNSARLEYKIATWVGGSIPPSSTTTAKAMPIESMDIVGENHRISAQEKQCQGTDLNVRVIDAKNQQ